MILGLGFRVLVLGSSWAVRIGVTSIIRLL